jgi:hypothetical protein
MSFWLIAAGLTALLATFVLGPLQRSDSRRLSWLLLILLPILALGLYLYLGNPAFLALKP